MSLLELGSVFEGYRVEEPVGRGGMGVVYRARQVDLDRVVALKVIRPELLDDPLIRERFLREARTAAAIDHPNVIPLHAAGVHDGIAYIVMRYVVGDDLHHHVRRNGPLPPHRAARVVAQLGEALDAIHIAGFVHRDVKPANIMLARGDHVYVTDFGLAKQAITRGDATRTGQWVGTLDYAAPEQIRGARVDARADVYSLGAVLYYALTGQVPFDRESDEARMYAHLADPPPVPSRLGVPTAFDAVVARAMAKPPDDRFPSAGDLGRAALAATAGEAVTQPERVVATGPASPHGAAEETAEASTATRPGTALTVAQPPPSRRRRALPAAVLGTLGAGAIGAFALLGDGDRGAPASATPSATAVATPVVKTVDGIGNRPNAIAAAGGDAWVGSIRNRRLIRFDGETVRRKPGGPQVGQGVIYAASVGDTIWVAIARERRLLRLDGKAGKVTKRISLQASPMAVAVDDRDLWVLERTLEGGGPDAIVRYDADGERRRARFLVAQGARAIAIGDGGVWYTERRGRHVGRLDRETGRRTVNERMQESPYDIAYAHGFAWVTLREASIVERIDPETGARVTIPAGVSPRQLLFSGGRLYVASYGDHTLVRIDPKTTRAEEGRVSVGLNPFALAADDEGRVWVTGVGDETVSRVTWP
jgi:tRNA A-37 threonylcarbamoyl transferase component Bud32/streptogramin lyase